jgi:hypothetical protein
MIEPDTIVPHFPSILLKVHRANPYGALVPIFWLYALQLQQGGKFQNTGDSMAPITPLLQPHIESHPLHSMPCAFS